MKKILKDDEVIVIAGKYKNKTGKVLKVFPKKNKALVEGINLIKKHTRPNPQINEQGGIVTKEAPMQLSNLAIYNPSSKKADRVGFKVLDDGKKVRVFKSNGEQVSL